MYKSSLGRRTAVHVGFLLLVALPALSETQRSSPISTPAPQPGVSVTRQGSATHYDNYLAGLTLSDEQKSRIDQIHRDMKSRMDLVVKDQRMNGDQKGAMLEGFARMEFGQIFLILTPDQRADVRKKIQADRAADKAAQGKAPAPAPSPK